ncbi:MAG TPA: cation:proton antiporter [Candidatus Omnitrophica bacterium]|nr:cation:proton antiporter [Candidatus Omnitrophota bacterium]
MSGEVSILFVVGSAIILAFLGGKVINKVRLPMVTGYVIVGVILGRSFFNIITPDVVNRLNIFNDLALGIIALLIGGEFHLRRIRALGKDIVFISLLEAFGAFILVSSIAYLFTKELYTFLILGAVASATAPAATVAVINQYRAKGPLTTTILGVVGSDDAIALMIFSFASAIAFASIQHTPVSLNSAIIAPLKKIFLSISLGGVVGYLLGISLKRVRNRVEVFAVGIGSLLIVEGLAIQWDLSELLAVMAMGIVGANTSPLRRFSHLMDIINIAGFPIIAAFFCLAGTKLNVRLLPQIGFLGLAYTIARMAGKMGGAYIGASIAKAPKFIRNSVGLGLFPQIGVAIAMAIVVEKRFSPLGARGAHLANLVINILLFTTVITEIVGPLLTKKALQKAGEIRKEF